jgi:Tetratricopeptide repeat
LELLTKTSENGFYVPLEPDGAPITPEVIRLRRLTLEPLTLSAPDSLQASAGELPPPQLAASILRTTARRCHLLDGARFCFIPSSADRYDTRWTLIQAEAQVSAIVEEGFALVLAGEVDKALEAWTRVLALPGVPLETAQAASYIGIAHHRAGRLDLAIAAYALAVDLGFASPSLQVEAATNRAQPTISRAKFDLVSIWENHPPAVPTGFIARALVYRGLTCERNGDAGGACEDFPKRREAEGPPSEMWRSADALASVAQSVNMIPNVHELRRVGGNFY